MSSWTGCRHQPFSEPTQQVQKAKRTYPLGTSVFVYRSAIALRRKYFILNVMFRPPLSFHEAPLAAARHEAAYYLEQTPDTAKCPFAEHFDQEKLSDVRSYMPRTPEIGPHREPDDGQGQGGLSQLAMLLSVARKDTMRIYRPAHEFLSDQGLSEDAILPIIRNSLPMAHHYASLMGNFATITARRAAKNPAEAFRNQFDANSQITAVNFRSEFIKKEISPLRIKGMGCSLLAVTIVSPHDGKKYNAFDLYWDAMAVQAANSV